jgi:DNA-binding CsgD family transcriptional regulator
MGGAASQHENEFVLDVLNIAEPAFAVNGNQQIVAWNDAAERLLGVRADNVIGLRCFEALEAFDTALCLDCSLCPASAMRVRPAAPACEAPAPQVERAERRMRLTSLAAHTTSGQARIVHLLREAPAHDTSRPLASALVNPEASGGRRPRPSALTQRELEVLRLLSAGHSTDEIAEELSITRITARNHVNKLLDKLGANSRLQAVVIASQLRLI